MVGGQGRGAELGLEDSPEGEDQVPEGLVLPAPSGWVSVGLSQEGRPLWVRPMGRGQTAAGMEPLNPEQPTLMALPCVPTIHRQWHPHRLHGCRVPIWPCRCPPQPPPRPRLKQVPLSLPLLVALKLSILFQQPKVSPAIGPLPSCSLCPPPAPCIHLLGHSGLLSQAVPHHWTTPDCPT